MPSESTSPSSAPSYPCGQIRLFTATIPTVGYETPQTVPNSFGLPAVSKIWTIRSYGREARVIPASVRCPETLRRRTWIMNALRATRQLSRWNVDPLVNLFCYWAHMRVSQLILGVLTTDDSRRRFVGSVVCVLIAWTSLYGYLARWGHELRTVVMLSGLRSM